MLVSALPRARRCESICISVAAPVAAAFWVPSRPDNSAISAARTKKPTRPVAKIWNCFAMGMSPITGSRVDCPPPRGARRKSSMIVAPASDARPVSDAPASPVAGASGAAPALPDSQPGSFSSIAMVPPSALLVPITTFPESALCFDRKTPVLRQLREIEFPLFGAILSRQVRAAQGRRRFWRAKSARFSVPGPLFTTSP
jgi:hypothetical protein